jgi:serine/threonine protein kinase
MAPEQAEMKPVSPATDIYALGLLLYEMVTGVPAFSGDTPVAVALKQIREYPKRPREIMPQLSGAVDAVIMKSLQKDPAKRFRSIDALNLALVKAAREPLGNRAGPLAGERGDRASQKIAPRPGNGRDFSEAAGLELAGKSA